MLHVLISCSLYSHSLNLKTRKLGVFRKPTRPSLPLKKEFFLPLRLSCKESSTFSPSPSQWSLHPLRFPRSRGTETSGSGDVTALCAVFLKSSRPSLPLKKAPPLISVFSPQGRRGKPPSGAQNRYAIRLAGHQSPRHVLRDGTALL